MNNIDKQINGVKSPPKNPNKRPTIINTRRTDTLRREEERELLYSSPKTLEMIVFIAATLLAAIGVWYLIKIVSWVYNLSF
jgi:hypothetical protein